MNDDIKLGLFDFASEFFFKDNLKIALRSKKTDNSPSYWAIVSRGGLVYNRDMELEYESSPSNRDDEFIKRTRFTLEEAVDLVGKIAGVVDYETNNRGK